MKLFTYILSFIFVALSCVEEIPLKDIHEPQVFLSGFIFNNGERVQVLLQNSVDLKKESYYESDPVPNAAMKLFSKDASGHKKLVSYLGHTYRGIYETEQKISTEEGNQYWIEVTLADGTVLESTPEEMLKPVRITDITFPTARTRVHFEDPADETNFYLIRYLYKDFGDETAPHFEVVNDQLFDGNKEAFHETDVIWGNVVTVEVNSISYGTYSFYLNYKAQREQEVEDEEADPFNNFLPPPSNMIGNVWYKGQGRMSLGYFGVISGNSMTKDVPGVKQGDLWVNQGIKDLGYINGPEDADVVILNCGDRELHSSPQIDGFDEWLANTGTEHVLKMNVYYYVYYHGTSLSQDSSLEHMEALNDISVSKLDEVATYFKDQGREVYIVGASFGASIVQKLIAEKGLYADGYLLMGGRLDMNEVFWKGLADGKKGHFVDGVTPVLTDQDGVFSQGLNRMVAAIQKYRFTEKLNQFDDLSKVTYVYGELDEVVGRLTDAEIAFLKAKNVNVIKGAGDHQETLDDYIARGIKEAFGIE